MCYGPEHKKQTRSLSNLLFHNKARRSKHWQIYCKGRDESVPRCCSWTLKPLLGAELKLILSVLHMNLMWKLTWRVFMKMRMVPASLVFCSWCFTSHLLFQSTSAHAVDVALHVPACGGVLRALEQWCPGDPLLSGDMGQKLWRHRQRSDPIYGLIR